jgi:hypothetical protein
MIYLKTWKGRLKGPEMGIFYGSWRDEGNELERKRKLRQKEGTRHQPFLTFGKRKN